MPRKRHGSSLRNSGFHRVGDRTLLTLHPAPEQCRHLESTGTPKSSFSVLMN
jgi:hypothetical protein